MAPLRALLATAILFTGCQGSNPPGPTDPFFGRTRIEPPHTGAVPGPSAVAPYYNPAAPQVTLPPAMVPLPGATSTVDPSPSLVFTQSDDPIAIPAAARQVENPNRQIASASQDLRSGTPDAPAKTATPIPVTIAKNASPVAPTASSHETLLAGHRSLTATAERERIYQTIGPRPKQVVVSEAGPAVLQTASSATLSPKVPVSGTIDIMDLPPPSEAAQPAQATADVQLVSAIVEINDPAGQAAATSTQGGAPVSFSQSSLYSYDPQYRQLRGRLEYSQIDHCWKLRYIPVDGMTDRFGGSVILANTDTLSGYERGDFVEVHGKLASTNPDNRTFSPTFEVQTVKLVRK